VAPGELESFAFPRANRKLLELIANRQPHGSDVRERRKS
jgi:hypothetical protein